MADEGTPCLFCLEQSQESNKVIHLDLSKYEEVPCSCRLYTHVDCWMTYFLKKRGFECPICHSKIVNTSIALSVDSTLPIRIDIPPIVPQRRTSCQRALYLLYVMLAVGISVIIATNIR